MGTPSRTHRTTALLGWLRGYPRAWLRADVVAGITLAAYLLPAGIADASLANLPAQAGLYACLLSGLVFWIFCSSRQTVVTTTSAISLLIGATLAPLANGDAARFGALAAGVALLVAAVALVAWLVRAGDVIAFISESVMIGYKVGVALVIASTQLPKLLGFESEHGSFWHRAGHFLAHLHERNPASLVIGVGALGLLVVGKLFLRRVPMSLIVVVAGIAISAITGLESRGVKLLGEVPNGLPDFGLPELHWSDLGAILPIALACFVLGAVETAAIGRMFAAKHHDRLDANREFLALSAANLAAALGRGLPVSGGMSQSLVNDNSGARTPLSGLCASIVMLLAVLFLAGFLRYLPQPVLAAVVLVAIGGLFDVAALNDLRRSDRREYLIALAALLGVLCFGLLDGVLIGALISLVLVLRRASHPHVANLGRIPGTRRFSDRDRHPDNEAIAGVLVLRPEASLVYFNVENACDAIRRAVAGQGIPPRLVLIDLSEVAFMDMQAARTLAGLAGGLADGGMQVRVVEAHSAVRDRLRAEGLDARLGGVNRRTSVADAIDAISDAETRRGSLSS